MTRGGINPASRALSRASNASSTRNPSGPWRDTQATIFCEFNTKQSIACFCSSVIFFSELLKLALYCFHPVALDVGCLTGLCIEKLQHAGDGVAVAERHSTACPEDLIDLAPLDLDEYCPRWQLGVTA